MRSNVAGKRSRARQDRAVTLIDRGLLQRAGRDLILLAALALLTCGIVLTALRVQAPRSEFPVDQSPAGVAFDGFYGVEQNATGAYRWSRPASGLVLPVTIPGTYRLTLDVQGPDAELSRDVQAFVDGRVVGTFPVTATRSAQSVDVTLPAEAWRSYVGGTLRVDLRTTPYTPPGDNRALGFIISRVALVPLATPHSPLAVLVPVLALVLGAAVFLRLLGLSSLMVAGVGGVVALVSAIPIIRAPQQVLWFVYQPSVYAVVVALWLAALAMVALAALSAHFFPASRVARLALASPVLTVVHCFAVGMAVFGTGVFLVYTREFGLDDSYITYRYAYHVEQGLGLVFNVGERYLGTTAPGQALLLAFLHRAIAIVRFPSLLAMLTGHDVTQASRLLDIPHLARYLSAFSAGSIVLAVYAAIAHAFRNVAACLIGLAGLLWLLVQPHLITVTGHETLIYVGLVVSGLLLWRRWPLAAAFVLGLATLIRPDAALAFAIAIAVSLPVWFRVGRDAILPALRAIGWYALPTLSWVLFAWVYYGSPIPGTLLAKRAQVSIGAWPLSSWESLTGYVTSAIPSSLGPLFAVGAIVGCLVALVRRDPFGLVPLWAFAHLIAYSLLHVTFWPWYATPLFVAYILTGIYGLAACAALLGKVRHWRGGYLPLTRLRSDERAARWRLSLAPFAILGVLALTVVCLGNIVAVAEPRWRTTRTSTLANPHIESFRQVAAYLRRQSPEGTSLATPEPGALAFDLGPQYLVIDTLGLTSPGVSQHILEQDYAWPYLHYRPEYVLVSYEFLNPNLQQPWFQEAYGQVAQFTDPYWTNQKITLRLFRLRQTTQGQAVPAMP